MTRAIMCRREGLTQAEESALYESITMPRPDMAFTFDDMQDPGGDTSPAAAMIEGLLFIAARVTLFVAAALLIVGIAFAAQAIRLDVQTLAPTVAEVSAVDFDLDRKLGEVLP